MNRIFSKKLFQSKLRFKTVITVYIIFMLVLTFFSKSLYNDRLPIVETIKPKQGRLSFAVFGSGEVSFGSVKKVYADWDGRVVKMLVKEGSFVKKGECLLRYIPDSSDSADVQEVRAKMDGVIVSVGVEEGMYISSHANTVLYEIAIPSSGWQISFMINEEQREKIDADSVPLIQLDEYHSIKGKIVSVTPVPDTEEYLYQIKIAFQSDDDLAGKRIKITVQRFSNEYDMMLPLEALQKDENQFYYVLKLQKSESVLGSGYCAQGVNVELLDDDGQYCAVRGLTPEDQIIIGGLEGIESGDEVYYEG